MERLGEHRPSFMLGNPEKGLSTQLHPGAHELSRNDTVHTFSHPRLLGGGTFDDTFRGLTIGFNLSRRLF